jgi:SpoVK/Ycf46/Vps4 family AAA+-type ATPase
MWANVIATIVLLLVVAYLHENGSNEACYKQAVASCMLPSSNVRLRDVRGLKHVKETLRAELVLPLHHPQWFAKHKVPFSRGFLLCGPPGCGKTTLAKALANESRASFFAPTLADLEHKYYGEASKLLRAVFDLARERAPSIIFLDELDGLGRARSDSEGPSYGMKTELLQLLDGVQGSPVDACVAVIGATNRAESLDQAIRRRLCTHLHIGPPTASTRRRILRTLSGVDPPRAVVSHTRGWSCSDLVEMYRRVSSRRLHGLRHLPKVLPAIDWTLAQASSMSSATSAQR